MLAFLFSFLSIILSFAVFLYIMVMGSSPRHHNSIIGTMYRIIINAHIIFGGACFSPLYFCNQREGRKAYKRWWDSTSKYREWIFVLLYIALVWPIEYLYLLHALPELNASVWSKTVSWALVLSSEVFYVLAVFTNPGKVTPGRELEKQHECLSSGKNASPTRKERANGSSKRLNDNKAYRTKRFRELYDKSEKIFGREWNCFSLRKEEEYTLNNQYIIDDIIYPASGYHSPDRHTAQGKKACNDSESFRITGMTCPTCSFPRPSRSKHCRYCNMCVRRFDHHCPWINNDVAEGTHRYFMAFIFMHTVSCLWASSDLFRCIKQFLLKNNAWGWTLQLNDGKTVPLRWDDYAKVLGILQTRNMFLILFANSMSLFLYCFFIYNLRFVIQNVTINDLNKMEELADFVARLPTLGLVYQEAMWYCQRLEKVALRKPKALYRLPKPPATEEPGYEQGGKKNGEYRNNVRKLLLRDLRGLFDRGVWNNLKEVFFPYKVLKEPRVSAVQ